MFLLLLRLITAPVVVLGATLVQRRFGHAVSGLLIGLPLSTMALLWLVGLQHAQGFTAAMSGSILAATGAQVVVLFLYARLALRYGANVALLVTLLAFVFVAGPCIVLNLSALLASVLGLGVTVVVLQLWPRTTTTTVKSGRYRLGLRMIIATGVTVAVVSLSSIIGPTLTGLVGALPVMSLTVAYVTHRDLGAHAVSQFLKGVTRGSFSYVLAMLTLTTFLRHGDTARAFLFAFVVAIAVQLPVNAKLTLLSASDALRTLSRVKLGRLAPENFRAVAWAGKRTAEVS